jgi:lambda family phage minor tail protein L
VRAPKRQCIANICQWVYRSTECGYTGSNYFDANDNSVATLAADVCGKRLTSCKLRFGATSELPYGSFPGIGAYTV